MTGNAAGPPVLIAVYGVGARCGTTTIALSLAWFLAWELDRSCRLIIVHRESKKVLAEMESPGAGMVSSTLTVEQGDRRSLDSEDAIRSLREQAAGGTDYIVMDFGARLPRCLSGEHSAIVLLRKVRVNRPERPRSPSPGVLDVENMAEGRGVPRGDRRPVPKAAELQTGALVAVVQLLNQQSEFRFCILNVVCSLVADHDRPKAEGFLSQYWQERAMWRRDYEFAEFEELVADACRSFHVSGLLAQSRDARKSLLSGLLALATCGIGGAVLAAFGVVAWSLAYTVTGIVYLVAMWFSAPVWRLALEGHADLMRRDVGSRNPTPASKSARTEWDAAFWNPQRDHLEQVIEHRLVTQEMVDLDQNIRPEVLDEIVESLRRRHPSLVREGDVLLLPVGTRVLSEHRVHTGVVPPLQHAMPDGRPLRNAVQLSGWVGVVLAGVCASGGVAVAVRILAGDALFSPEQGAGYVAVLVGVGCAAAGLVTLNQ